MDWITYYLIGSISAALTIYLIIWKPALHIVEEVLEKPAYNNNFIVHSVFFLVTVLLAPLMMMQLFIINDNNKVIQKSASSIIESKNKE